MTESSVRQPPDVHLWEFGVIADKWTVVPHIILHFHQAVAGERTGVHGIHWLEVGRVCLVQAETC